jgi:chromosome partitioning related protein ParA
MIKFAVVGSKGGIGKTTVCANLAAIFADLGLRVLMIDADLQPALSKYFNLVDVAPKGLFEVITTQTITADCISRTEIENLDIIVSNDAQQMLQPWLISRVDNQDRLINALGSPFFADGPYDIVVIDTQGAQGPLQNCAILAANQILLPVVPETLAARELTTSTHEMIARLEPSTAYKNRLGTIKAFFYRNDRSADAKKVTEDLRENFFVLEGRLELLNASVPQAVAYKDSSTKRSPAHRFDRKSKNKTPCAWDVMHELAWELVPPLKGAYAFGLVSEDSTEGQAA